MRQSASAAFIEAAGVLAQDQDAAVRQALAAAANPAARSQGLDQLWGLAQTESPTAPALLRASSALMAAFEDPRAAEALERASAHNPQDIHMWRLSSFMFSKAGETGQAEGAAIVAGALDRAAQGDRANAAADFARALPLIERPAARGYVLGQLGDYAVETDDLRAALNHYKEAVAVLAKAGAAGALSLEASKLARVHIALGDPAAACAA
jgi:tetratricopeptide (TPR) repeat protein